MDKPRVGGTNNNLSYCIGEGIETVCAVVDLIKLSHYWLTTKCNYPI